MKTNSTASNVFRRILPAGYPSLLLRKMPSILITTRRCNNCNTKLIAFTNILKYTSMKKTLATLIALMTIISFLYAQPGSLDSNFGVNGKTVITGGQSIALQPDGKILITTSSGSNRVSITRYLKNGKIDRNFGNRGTASTVFMASYLLQSSNQVAAMPDGKIIVASGVFNGDIQEAFLCVACFKSTGLIDSSFGTNGQVEVPVAQWGATASGIIIQPNGNFIISIANNDFSIQRIAAIRFKKNGVEDKDFYIQFSIYDICNAMDAQADGRVIITGSSEGKFNLFRFNKNGLIDKTFGKKGNTVLQNNLEGLDVAVLPDDKIVVVTADSTLIQFQSNGKIDTSFGERGKKHLSFKANSVAIQKDGKIIIAGSINNGTNTDFAIARYLPSGLPDKKFGSNGITITDFGGSEQALDMAIQTDNKIIVSGSGGLARYKAGHVASFQNISTEIQLSSNIMLQPNPANNYITITGLKQHTKKIVEITNAFGMLVFKQISNDESLRCDISSLHPGIYYVSVSDATGIVKKSFIKE